MCLSSVVYAVDGDAIIQACIEQRTDYVDWFVLSSPPLTIWYLTVIRSAAVPTLIRDWIAKYHEQAEANGVAVNGTTE